MGLKKVAKFIFALAAAFFTLLLLVGIFSLFFGDGLGRDKVAVVTVKGIITDSRSVIEQLHDAEETPSIKAIVIRVNSPGGGVGASQEIYREVSKIREKKEKKVVVSMGSVAASGGYYIACGAEKIYANPGSLTGSIGVLMEFANIEDLLNKIGLKGYVIKSGEHKDIGSPLRPMTDPEREILQGVIDNTYRQFVKVVSRGRKLPEDYVKGLADGRIFTGEQAKDLKLVDELGNLQDAIDGAAKMAGIEKPYVKYMEKRRFSLFGLFLGEEAESIFSGLSSQMFGLNYLFIPGKTFFKGI
jgi:protease-4